jgi:hypothetical protein
VIFKANIEGLEGFVDEASTKVSFSYLSPSPYLFFLQFFYGWTLKSCARSNKNRWLQEKQLLVEQIRPRFAQRGKNKRKWREWICGVFKTRKSRSSWEKRPLRKGNTSVAARSWRMNRKTPRRVNLPNLEEEEEIEQLNAISFSRHPLNRSKFSKRRPSEQEAMTKERHLNPKPRLPHRESEEKSRNFR